MKKIAIHSAPRSGSTWLGSIFDSSPMVAYRFQPLFSYTHKNQLDETSKKKEIDHFFRDILLSNDEFVLQKNAVMNSLVPSFLKKKHTHLVYKEVRYHNVLSNLLEQDKDIKVIGLIRNPLSTINSWLRAPKEFLKHEGWVEKEEWQWANKKNKAKPEEFNGYEKWKEVAYLFEKLAKKHPQQFYLVKYSDLIEDTSAIVSSIFNFCDIDITNQTLDYLKNSNSGNKLNDDHYSVFKSKKTDNNWINQLDKEIVEKIQNDLEGTILSKYLSE